MSVKTRKTQYTNRKLWRYLRIPIVIIAVLCLMHFHNLDHFSRAATSHAEMPATLDTFISPVNGDGKKVGYWKDFRATAYCITGITKSGVPVESGHVAADPKVIPLGSLIYVESPLMGGIYQVTDTGRLIKGSIIDIFIPSYRKSIEFGRRKVKVKVLRYGYENDQRSHDGHEKDSARS